MPDKPATPDQPTEISWHPRVEALIAKWRDHATLCEPRAELAIEQCADELSALLAPEQPKEETR